MRTRYVASTVLMLLFTFAPYAWEHMHGVIMSKVSAQSLFAVLWAATCALTVYWGRGNWKRWWQFATMPIALFQVAETLFTLYCWKTGGFAP